jgi:hypothetical protein
MLGDLCLGYGCLFPQQPCKQHLWRFGELCSADGEQDIEIFLGCHSGEAYEAVGAPCQDCLSLLELNKCQELMPAPFDDLLSQEFLTDKVLIGLLPTD